MDEATAAGFVREQVARTYAKAVGPRDGVRLAGYRDDDLAALPEGAAGEFLGCGNPLAFADVREGDTVLDLGSGAGVDVILAAQKVGPAGRVIGVDMTDAMIRRAQTNVARAGLTNVEIRHGQIESLPVEAASVDWVISNCVISLSPEKERVFREVARVLRPGGSMLVSDIVVDGALSAVLSRMTRIAPSFAGARTEKLYREAMSKAGLEAIDVRGRFVYEPDHLLALVGGAAGDPDRAATCPVSRVRLSRGALGLVAHLVAGRVWSAKFYAKKPVSV